VKTVRTANLFSRVIGFYVEELNEFETVEVYWLDPGVGKSCFYAYGMQEGSAGNIGSRSQSARHLRG
jgi:hypothetical protein